MFSSPSDLTREALAHARIRLISTLPLGDAPIVLVKMARLNYTKQHVTQRNYISLHWINRRGGGQEWSVSISTADIYITAVARSSKC